MFGVIQKPKATWLRLQANGVPTIGRIDFTVKPDSLDLTSDLAFFDLA